MISQMFLCTEVNSYKLYVNILSITIFTVNYTVIGSVHFFIESLHIFEIHLGMIRRLDGSIYIVPHLQ